MKQGSIYKGRHGESVVKELYDRQLKAIDVVFEDLYVETRFGQSHLLKLGNPNGKPLLLFHGGNSTTPHTILFSGLACLFAQFCVYAVDTIGHPGKSAQTVLSAKSMEYGEWASDVIEGLGFQKMICIGGSFGGGILVKLMCFAPEKIEKAVLLVPAGIANVSTLNVVMKMGIPMLFYIVTKNDYWLKKAILPMAIHEENITAVDYEMARYAFEYVRVKAEMPSNVKMETLKKCHAPVFLIPAEKDCLFPGKKIIEKAKKTFPNLTIHLLLNQGHIFTLSDEVRNMINKFIDK